MSKTTTTPGDDSLLAATPALKKAYAKSTTMPGLIFAAEVEALGARLPGIAQDLKDVEALSLAVAKALEVLLARASAVRAFREGGR